MVNYAVPRKDLIKIAPEVLRSTQETIRSIMNMPIEMAYEYPHAKSDQLRFRDHEQTRARGMEEFLVAKSYRPGSGPVKRS